MYYWKLFIGESIGGGYSSLACHHCVLYFNKQIVSTGIHMMSGCDKYIGALHCRRPFLPGNEVSGDSTGAKIYFWPA